MVMSRPVRVPFQVQGPARVGCGFAHWTFTRSICVVITV
jgi:hypothetical protein